ncbi:MAG: PspA/IM30 family protein [Polyangiaceae bacterium]|nr:PspA/IM30 family protein [Polyangiaceae bacterium]
MGLFDRAGKAIASNFNALLDKVENPDKSLDLLVEEMREQVRAARREIVRSVAREKQLKKTLEEHQVEADRWTGRAELAVRQGDDELARQALIQKRRVTGERDRVEALRTQQHAAALELKDELARMEHTVEDIAARKGSIGVRVRTARAGGGPEALGARSGSSPFEQFRRMEAEVSGAEIALEAQREVEEALSHRGPAGLSAAEIEARFQALEQGPTASSGASDGFEVDRELEAIRHKIRIGS